MSICGKHPNKIGCFHYCMNSTTYFYLFSKQMKTNKIQKLKITGTYVNQHVFGCHPTISLFFEKTMLRHNSGYIKRVEL